MRAMVIGHGSAGKRHEEAYRSLGINAIVVDRSNGWRAHLPDVEIVSICSPDEFHFDQAVECLKAGKHVMVEKPPCTRPDEAAFLEKWANEHPEQAFACCLPLPWRFAEFADKIPEIGQIYQIEMEYNYGRRNKLMEGWRANRNYSMVLGAGLHMIDLMLWLFPSRPVDGSAIGISTTKVRHDTIQAIMKMNDGAIARLAVNGGYEGRHFHRVKVSGLGGVLEMDTDNDIDHLAPVKTFVETIMRGERVRSGRLWDAMRICFNIEGQL